jgi:hypothetical protein
MELTISMSTVASGRFDNPPFASRFLDDIGFESASLNSEYKKNTIKWATLRMD